MGIITSLRRKFGRNNKAELAADQLYQQLVARNTAIEIPAAMSMESDVTNMVLAFREKYGKQVDVTMLQSKGIVLKVRPAKIGDEALGHLAAHGYFPGAELSPEMFLDQHAAFMERNGDSAADVADEVAKELRRQTAFEVYEREVHKLEKEEKLKPEDALAKAATLVPADVIAEVKAAGGRAISDAVARVSEADTSPATSTVAE